MRRVISTAEMARFSFYLMTMNETQNNVLQALLHSRKFWIAVFALIQLMSSMVEVLAKEAVF